VFFENSFFRLHILLFLLARVVSSVGLVRRLADDRVGVTGSFIIGLLAQLV
jgi:hypothetical protein